MKSRAGPVIVDQEARQRPDHDEQDGRREQAPDRDLGPAEQRRRDQSDAGRQPVHVVEHIEGIGQPDDPEDRDRAARGAGG